MQEQIKKGVVLKDKRFEDKTLYTLVTSNKVKPSGTKGFLNIKGIVLQSTDKTYIGISLRNIEIVKTEIFAENLLEYYEKIVLSQFTDFSTSTKNTPVEKRPICQQELIRGCKIKIYNVEQLRKVEKALIALGAKWIYENEHYTLPKEMAESTLCLFCSEDLEITRYEKEMEYLYNISKSKELYLDTYFSIISPI